MLQQAASAAGHTVEQQLDDEGMKRLVRSLLGMSQEGMEDTLQLVITRDGHITEGTIGQSARSSNSGLPVRGLSMLRPRM